MKILFLQNYDFGLYLFRRELIEKLVEENEVYYSTPRGFFSEKINTLGCQYIPCDVLERKSKNPITDLKLLLFYLKTIKKVKPDVVFTYTLKPVIYGGLACEILGTRYFPNITGMGTTNSFSKNLNRLLDFLMKCALKKADCVFFQNETAKSNMINRHIVKGRHRLLPGSGVNLEHYDYYEYPQNDNVIVFLFVGRIREDKGIGEFLYAIRRLHNEDKRAEGYIVGPSEEDYKSELEAAIDEGAAQFYGHQNDVIPFYRTAHCVVLPSYHEGMSNALLEGSAIGRPVIASNVPGCKEVFIDGVSGFGCEVKDKEGLYTTMKKFLNLSNAQKRIMGQEARKLMIKNFDRNIVIDAYLDELKRIDNARLECL